jgi:hypothetical protein
MKSLASILLILLFVFSSCSVYPQKGWGPGSNYNRMYDVNTVETISGQVTKVDKIYPDNNMSYGIHLTLSTTTGEISVHLGPGWFIENQDTEVNAGDNVTVTGSKVTYEGSEVIIAKEVTKGDEVLKLRDDNGFPLWSGWRNRR